ncbi:23S rRNA and tRNA pseudouridine synthase [Campylobacter blaseri]|uniref:RNA pseudouridylate synthase n=1 Tax=Campylobacter blaseri TaxID=2042961 RepID=A0A2P8R086_9BACT|nr:RNA pseudouridine synthase [Campylobacter blaseri]PSM51906.1 RNA pseudouridine synthase [Campylobacter blaseri]PSM53690.1 RNA pseudouridine synthase [Campylobacter blaseri]QKF85756.1 23S rRNA and tRNA pseudouridine synthase [Campylobacter blaseri]
MTKEKAYKLLAVQEGISNNEAKNLIDNGQVFAHDKKILIARGLISSKTTFKVLKTKEPKVIFEDDNIVAINKPQFTTSEQIAKKFKFELLNRLDKDTSGVILLIKNKEFQEKAIEEFKHLRVKKIYVAMVDGIVSEEIIIDEPIITLKTKGGAFSKISKQGKNAITKVEPLMISGKKSIVKVTIQTGRTHQIRVHLASINHPIVGDEKYGKGSSKRLFLHSYETEILGYKFRANLDNSFHAFGFEIPKDI